MSILKPLMEKVKKNKNTDYLFFVYGTHMDKSFGSTISEIKKIGLKITDKAIQFPQKIIFLVYQSLIVNSEIHK